MLSPAFRERGPDLLAATIVAGTVVESLLFAWMERSFPRDLNLAYGTLPEIYARTANGRLADVAHFAVEPGGWYNAAIAAWLHVAGRSGPAFTVVGALWSGLLCVAVLRLASAWGGRETGPWAGVAAVALVAAAPGLTFQARAGWIHTPEAALIALAASALAHDHPLKRRMTVATLAIAGALAIALRPSGIVWILVLAAGVLAGMERSRAWAARALLVGGVWLLACRIPLPVIREYTQNHWTIRVRYAEIVPNIAEQLWHGVGGPGVLLTGVGLLALGVFARRHPRGPALRAILLGGWIALSLAMFVVVRCGLDNFPLLFVSLAILAGIGLGRDPRLAGFTAAFSLATLAWRAGTDVLAPATTLPSTRVHALLDATCPDRSGGKLCVVYIDQGLFFPQSEEPGALELFLMREGRVQAIPLSQRRGPEPSPDALATWNCGERDAMWLQRFPRAGDERAFVIRRFGLVSAWKTTTDGCDFSWMTPGGTLAGAVEIAGS